VTLLAATGVIAFLSGLAKVSSGTAVSAAPSLGLSPAAVQLATFALVMLAILLGLVAVGLYREYRVAWWTGVVVLVAIGGVTVVTLAPFDLVTIGLLIGALFALLVTRRQFRRPVGLTNIQLAALSSAVGVLAYGVVGTWALREEFIGLETLADAVYYVIVTIATVGYGDITPATLTARWFSLSVILLGVGAFTASIGSFVSPLIESRMSSAIGTMTPSQLAYLEDHIVVLGRGDMTAPLVEQLAAATEVVVVTPTTEGGHIRETDGVTHIDADPTDEQVLAGLDLDDVRAVIVGSHDDAMDVLIILSVRNVAPAVPITAIANDARFVSKLEAVGADEVLDLWSMAGSLIGEAVLESAEDADAG
jgi:voltage-gated potassium channel